MIVAALLAMSLVSAIPAVASTGSIVSERLDEGRKLHDSGDYDGAIRIYASILQEDPDNPHALYETAFSRYAKGEYEQAVPLLEKVLAGGKGDLALAWAQLGNTYDALKEWKKAEKAFRKGLKGFPEHAPLRYNLGINLAYQDRHEEAMEELIANLGLRPAHPGGWLALAGTTRELRQRHRAFFAYARFLTIEPDSKRSPDAATEMWNLLFEGVRKKAEPDSEGKDQIDVQIDPRISKQRSDPKGAIYMAMSLLAAGRYTERWEGKTDAEFFAGALEDLVAIGSEMQQGERQDPFWNTYTLGYFAQAREAGHLEPLAYDIRRSLAEPEVLKWLEEHHDAVDRFRVWSKEWTAK